MRSKNVLKNTLLAFLNQLIVIICGFIVPKLLIQKYGSNVNGLVSSINSFLAYISLLDAGFTAVIKSQLYKPIVEKDSYKIKCILSSSSKFFKRIAKIFLIYILILLIVYPLIISNTFDWKYTDTLILIISVGTFVEYYFGMTSKLFLQSMQKAYIVTAIYSITTILNTILIVILVKLGVSIHVLKLISSCIFIVRPIFFNWYIQKKYNINTKEKCDEYEIKNKWDGFAQHIASVVHNNTDIVVLTVFSTLENISIYSVYIMICAGIKNLASAITSGIDATFGNMLAKDEKNNLNNRFNNYEVIYFLMITILFVPTIILIAPFVQVYTSSIMDVNYVNYTFGYLLVISEFIWAVRLPYSSITLAAGHFKETKKGAWLEAFLNIGISILLVRKYGIIGVAIGTIVAMTVRTIEFVYHTNKYILQRSIFASFKKIFMIIIEGVMIFFICQLLPYVNNISYINWGINAFMVFVCTLIIVIGLNTVFYRKDLKQGLLLVRNIFKRKSKKKH